MDYNLSNAPAFRGGGERGMARKTLTLTVWVAPEALAQIDAIAKRNNLTRAAFARKCINAGYRTLIGEGELLA